MFTKALLTRSLVTAVAVLALVGCTGGAGDDAGSAEEATATPTLTTPTIRTGTNQPNRTYSVEWLVNSAAAGRERPGFVYLYREVVDDSEGVYLAEVPDHLAVQTREEVIFCAAILRSNGGVCSKVERPSGVPDVVSIAVETLRDWGPESVFELADPRLIETAAEADPTSWQRRNAVLADTPVECFAVVDDTNIDVGVALGFEVCFIDDDERLVASLDVQGDLVFEIDLLRYGSSYSENDLLPSATPAESPALFDQLVAAFPDLPAEPTPTAVADE